MSATVHSLERDREQRDRLTAIERRMKAFVEGQLSKTPQPDVFVLGHIAGETTAIHSYKLESKKNKSLGQSEIAEAVAKEMLSTATDHFESFGVAGAQRYRLAAETKGEVIHPYFFGLGAKQAAASSDEPIETEKIPGALMNQLMKQNKDLGEVMFEAVPRMLQTTVEQFQLMASEVTRLNQTQIQAKVALEDSLSRQTERQILLDREAATQKTRNDLLNKLINDIWPEVKTHLKGHIKRKMLGAPANSKPVTDPNEDARQRAEAQFVCREAFKVIGREALVAALPEDKRHLIDDLTGIGSDPKDMPEFREKLREFYNEIPEAASQEMEAKFVSSGKAELMQMLMGIVIGEEGQNADATSDSAKE